MRARPGGSVGRQRQRAWIEVFSSAQTTKSRLPKGLPSKMRAYRSNTTAALAVKSGSAGKYPGAVQPGADGVAVQDAPHRGCRDGLHHCSHDQLTGQPGATPARQRHARLRRRGAPTLWGRGGPHQLRDQVDIIAYGLLRTLIGVCAPNTLELRGVGGSPRTGRQTRNKCSNSWGSADWKHETVREGLSCLLPLPGQHVP
jgi:hypothetical protein